MIEEKTRYQEIGEKIKEAREELNISQQELAKSIGFSSGTAVALIESGERRVSIDKLEEISKALNRDLTYFLDGKESPRSTPDVKTALRSSAGYTDEDKKFIIKLLNKLESPKEHGD